MIPGARWDMVTLNRRHREIADQWRGRGYLADVPTITAERSIVRAALAGIISVLAAVWLAAARVIE